MMAQGPCVFPRRGPGLLGLCLSCIAACITGKGVREPVCTGMSHFILDTIVNWGLG